MPLSPLPATDAGQRTAWSVLDGIPCFPAAGWAAPDGGRLRLRRRVDVALAMKRAVGRACAAIDELIGREAIDAVIGYTAWYLFGEAVLRHCRDRGLTTVRDVNEGVLAATFPGGAFNPLYWNQRMAVRRSVPRDGGVIAISQRLERHFAARGLSVLRVPALIDASQPDGPAPPSRGPAEPFNLTYLGACRWRDAPTLLLAAVRKLVNDGLDVRLTIVGSDGMRGASSGLRRRVQRDAVLRERVRFTGRVGDDAVVHYLQDSDALILNRRSGPSGECAFPTRLPEYLMSGRPVVASDVGDVRTYLRDGEDIILVPPDGTDALAAGIRRLIDSPDRGRALGARGRERCRACFDCGEHGRRIAEFLDALIAARRAD